MRAISLLKGAVVLMVAAGMLDATRVSNAMQALREPTGRAEMPARTVRLMFSDGHVRTYALEGVGCSVSICSRVAIDGVAAGDTAITSIALDSVSVFELHDADALVRYHDGTIRRLSVSPWNRVLYVDGEDGRERIDLRHVTFAEFLAGPR
jgi:hypothetical protein